MFRESKISQLDMAVRVQEDILRLQVAVDNVLAMQIGNSK